MQDQIVARQNLLEILRLVVDDNVRAETLDQFDIFRTRRRRDCRAEMLGKLDGKCPDATGAGLDEDLLPGLHLGNLHKRLPRSQPYQRDGGRFLHADALGL